MNARGAGSCCLLHNMTEEEQALAQAQARARRAEAEPEGYLHRAAAAGPWHRYCLTGQAACGEALPPLGERELWALNILPPADALCRRCFPGDAVEVTEGLNRRPRGLPPEKVSQLIPRHTGQGESC